MQPKKDINELYEYLLQGCLDQHRDAQKALYELMAGKMFAVCLRYTNNRESAEDILQEGFVKVFTNIDKYRHTGSFEGWVRKIMVNTAVEHFRRQNRMYPVLSLDLTDSGLAVELPDTEMEVEDLIRMIGELSPGYRTIFNLYAVEGYSHREIAELLQISEGTSKSQLARARYILQEKLERTYFKTKTGQIAR